MGVTGRRAIGVLLLLAGVSMLLIAADLVYFADVVWEPYALFEVSLLASIGIASVVFGFKGMLAAGRPR